MKSVATTRMSSKGQVVIPESIREDLGLQPGDQFVVVGQGDVVILKTLAAPDTREYDNLVRKARQDARKAGLTKAHVRNAVRRARRKS
ncbi:MAG: AbrB/MazE/SpoVT family DNA-binding domain-containing protein [Phycisphaerae bacterium]|nr:AbrB/MazE/SpoVT family DNA-binding domain-containing protein [Phycisphaerae bacterium]